MVQFLGGNSFHSNIFTTLSEYPQKLSIVIAVMATADKTRDDAPEKAIVKVIGPVSAALQMVIFLTPDSIVITSSRALSSKQMPRKSESWKMTRPRAAVASTVMLHRAPDERDQVWLSQTPYFSNVELQEGQETHSSSHCSKSSSAPLTHPLSGHTFEMQFHAS